MIMNFEMLASQRGLYKVMVLYDKVAKISWIEFMR